MLESMTKQACLNSISYISNKVKNYCNMFRHSHLYSLIHSIIKSYFSSRRRKFGYIHPTAFVRLPTIIKGTENVYMYERTHILSNSVILTTNAKFILKKNSGAAEGLTVVTGNHYSVVGKFFMDITDADKPKDMDQDITVAEDVWMATNVTLLMGAHIGRGAVIGAGSVIRSKVPPYAIVMGNPAMIVGFKFNPEQVIEHEKDLYPPEERLPLDLLEKNYKKYFLDRVTEIKSFTKI